MKFSRSFFLLRDGVSPAALHLCFKYCVNLSSFQAPELHMFKTTVKSHRWCCNHKILFANDHVVIYCNPKSFRLQSRQLSWFGPGRQPRTTRQVYCSSPHWGGEENAKKRQKLMGRDTGSLTEQRRKQTVTTTTLMSRVYKNKEMHGTILSHRPTPTQHRAWHHRVSNTQSVGPVWVSWPSCVPPSPRLLVK